MARLQASAGGRSIASSNGRSILSALQQNRLISKDGSARRQTEGLLLWLAWDCRVGLNRLLYLASQIAIGTPKPGPQPNGEPLRNRNRVDSDVGTPTIYRRMYVN